MREWLEVSNRQEAREHCNHESFRKSWWCAALFAENTFVCSGKSRTLDYIFSRTIFVEGSRTDMGKLSVIVAVLTYPVMGSFLNLDYIRIAILMLPTRSNSIAGWLVHVPFRHGRQLASLR